MMVSVKNWGSPGKYCLLGFWIPPNSCPAVVILSYSVRMGMFEGNVNLFSLGVKGYFDPSTFLDVA